MTQVLCQEAEALHRLGLSEAAAGRLEAAVDHLARAVELSPESAPFRSNLALAWGMTGDWERAAACASAVRRQSQRTRGGAGAGRTIGGISAVSDRLC